MFIWVFRFGVMSDNNNECRPGEVWTGSICESLVDARQQLMAEATSAPWGPHKATKDATMLYFNTFSLYIGEASTRASRKPTSVRLPFINCIRVYFTLISFCFARFSVVFGQRFCAWARARERSERDGEGRRNTDLKSNKTRQRNW